MLITAIEKRRKMLSALFLDGEFAVNIDTETLLQFRYMKKLKLVWILRMSSCMS